MSSREMGTYFAAFILGIVTLYPYFLMGGEVSSKVWMWARLVAYAVLLFGSLRLVGQLRFRLLIAYCAPVTAISLLLGMGGSSASWNGLLIAAEPIVCVWAGASLALLLLRYFRPRDKVGK